MGGSNCFVCLRLSSRLCSLGFIIELWLHRSSIMLPHGESHRATFLTSIDCKAYSECIGKNVKIAKPDPIYSTAVEALLHGSSI